MKCAYRLIFYLMTCSHINIAWAQNGKSVGIDGQFGFVWAHTKGIDHTAQARPVVVQLSLNSHYHDSTVKQLLGFALHKGWLFQFVDFRLPVLGQLYTTAYYMQPTWNFHPRLTFGVRAIGGIGFATNPYHAQSNSTNLSYSSKLNPFLSLGLMFQYRVSEHLFAQTSVHYNHISNGGMSKPNKGVNWPTMGLGLAFLMDHPVPDLHISESSKPHYYTDYIVYGSFPMREEMTRKRYGVGGLGIKLARRSRLHGWSIGGEITHDRQYRASAQSRFPEETYSWLSGFLVGHEFKMGKFIFSQELGVYVYQPAKIHAAWYHRWGLMYYPKTRWGLGINLKAHGEQANFLDLRTVYTVN